MPSAPRVGEGAEARLERAGRRRRGLGQRCRRARAASQNSSALSSTRSTNSSSPKRIVSGTISMPSASTSGCGQIARAVGDDADPHGALPIADDGRVVRRDAARAGVAAAGPAAGARASRELVDAGAAPEPRGRPRPPTSAADDTATPAPRRCVDHPIASATTQLTPATDARPRPRTCASGGRDRAALDAAEAAVEHDEREHRGDEVREREREREPGDAEPRVERERERRC